MEILDSKTNVNRLLGALIGAVVGLNTSSSVVPVAHLRYSKILYIVETIAYCSICTAIGLLVGDSDIRVYNPYMYNPFWYNYWNNPLGFGIIVI